MTEPATVRRYFIRLTPSATGMLALFRPVDDAAEHWTYAEMAEMARGHRALPAGYDLDEVERALKAFAKGMR